MCNSSGESVGRCVETEVDRTQKTAGSYSNGRASIRLSLILLRFDLVSTSYMAVQQPRNGKSLHIHRHIRFEWPMPSTAIMPVISSTGTDSTLLRRGHEHIIHTLASLCEREPHL